MNTPTLTNEPIPNDAAACDPAVEEHAPKRKGGGRRTLDHQLEQRRYGRLVERVLDARRDGRDEGLRLAGEKDLQSEAHLKPGSLQIKLEDNHAWRFVQVERILELLEAGVPLNDDDYDREILQYILRELVVLGKATGGRPPAAPDLKAERLKWLAWRIKRSKELKVQGHTDREAKNKVIRELRKNPQAKTAVDKWNDSTLRDRLSRASD